MPFQLPRRIFAISAVLCVLLRVYLHVACLDPETGFYSGGLPVIVIYYVILAASAAAMLFLGLRGNTSQPEIAVTPLLRASTLAASVGAAIMAVPNSVHILGPDYLPRSMAVTGLRLFALSLAPLVTAVLLIYLAVKGKRAFARVNGYLMLLPVIWMAVLLLTRFMDYTASRHVSDQMLTIVTLALGTLFLLPLGRFAAGLTPGKAARQLAGFGLPFALLAFSVCAGILAGPHTGVTLALSIPESAAFLLLGQYAAVMAFSLREGQAA